MLGTPANLASFYNLLILVDRLSSSPWICLTTCSSAWSSESCIFSRRIWIYLVLSFLSIFKEAIIFFCSSMMVSRFYCFLSFIFFCDFSSSTCLFNVLMSFSNLPIWACCLSTSNAFWLCFSSKFYKLLANSLYLFNFWWYFCSSSWIVFSNYFCLCAFLWFFSSRSCMRPDNSFYLFEFEDVLWFNFSSSYSTTLWSYFSFFDAFD